MALKRVVIDGFGQIEPNNVTFTRDGRIEAQVGIKCVDADGKLVDFIENGMLLAVSKARGVHYVGANETDPIALNYTSERIYNQFTPGLKNFCVKKNEIPRLGFLTNGEVFTTNCLCYDNEEFEDEAALKAALKAIGTTPLYGGACAIGAIKISATKPTVGPVLIVEALCDMPDGQPAVEFQVR